ncbi:MAG: TIGR01906 family membrane protein [Chloroflexi bacterium]|nr:TIGR01906 family membrane protein [Chloroflexota bacterium]
MTSASAQSRPVAACLVSLLAPLALILTAVRLLLTPCFLQVEYRLPGFPADPYGLTQEERLRWAPLAVDYLVNAADIAFLADQRFADGSPLYDARELQHMEDVKALVGAALRVWLGALAALLGLALWAWRGGWWPTYRHALGRGGWLTVGLLALLVAAAAVSFRPLFVLFHRLFFEGDSWLFDPSTTLIRLFPMRFWRDAFALAGLLPLAGGLALGLWAGRSAGGGQNVRTGLRDADSP